ncbi:MAG: DMT family transporter [Lachnospiraceae bacterium]|nr:DMT family transporter [Lachnospiraceae bacterium]
MKSKNKAIIYITLSALGFATMSMFVKLAGDLPSIEKSFFRNLVAFFCAWFLLKRSGYGFHFKRENLFHLILRSTLGTIGIFCNFYAVDHMVLSDANMLNKLSPFFVIIFSYIFLKEKIAPFQGVAIALAFVGSLFIIKPSFLAVSFFPACIGLLGGITAGAAYTCVRYLGTRGEKGPVIVMFFSGFSCLVTIPYLIFAYQPISGRQLVCLLMAGVAAACGQFGVTAAYANAPAKEISIFDYSQILFSALYSIFLFGDIPDRYSVLGYVIIITMSLLNFLYNNGKLSFGKKKNEI